MQKVDIERFPFRAEEARWQKIWQEKEVFQAKKQDSKQPKCYVLEMLPYPSGRIHIGHTRNYVIGDVFARFKKALGFNVLHPMGWDAFGLPAENAAIQNKCHPASWTYQNIADMKAQLAPLGLSYDWNCEFATCDTNYYRHQQKFFLDFYHNDLAYQKEAWVNWDPVEQTVLANEQVVDGRGWRSDAIIERRKLKQWFFKTTAFADDLLESLKTLTHWPEKVIAMQANWINRSIGAKAKFQIVDHQDIITVFTTRPETLFGASFCAIAPDHPLTQSLARSNENLQAFIEECTKTGTAEEILETIEKKGYDTGLKVINPVNPKQTLPLYVTNYIVMDYGTGAIFGCPAHDERDFEFATRYELSIVPVIQPQDETLELPLKQAYIGDGIMINSSFMDGLKVAPAIDKAIEYLETNDLGEKTIQYRLRDWGVSRQRYWGCPIPIIYCPKCGVVPVPEKDLPVKLPEDVNFDQPGNPLKNHPAWKYVSCPQCGEKAERETDTLDTFVDSSWYFLRYCSPHANQPFDPDAVGYWMPVDHYIGGIEHAVMHLLYARFFCRALRHCGYKNVPKEPFSHLLTQGMVCHQTYKTQDGNWLYPEEVEWDKDQHIFRRISDKTFVIVGRSEKMSKSRMNVIEPMGVIMSYGVDAIRLVMVSDTPVDRDVEWSEEGIEGCWRFINRVWRLIHQILPSLKKINPNQSLDEPTQKLRNLAHKTVHIVTGDLEKFRFNSAVARIRELVNTMDDYCQSSAIHAEVLQEVTLMLIKLLAPITPHLAESLWAALGHKDLVVTTTWPKADPALLQDDVINIAVQVNGKLRGTVAISPDTNDDTLKQAALDLENVQRAIGEHTIRKVIVVPKRIVNIVVA